MEFGGSSAARQSTDFHTPQRIARNPKLSAALSSVISSNQRRIPIILHYFIDTEPV